MMIILIIITLIIAQGSLGSGEGREEEINQVCHFNWIIVLLLLCYCVLSHLFKSCFSFSLKSHLNISIQDGERNDGRRRKGNSRNEGGRGEDGEKIYQVLKKISQHNHDPSHHHHRHNHQERENIYEQVHRPVVSSTCLPPSSPPSMAPRS